MSLVVSGIPDYSYKIKLQYFGLYPDIFATIRCLLINPHTLQRRLQVSNFSLTEPAITTECFCHENLHLLFTSLLNVKCFINKQSVDRTNIFVALVCADLSATFSRPGELSRDVGETGGRNEPHIDSPP